ncbi:MAG: hypothetical protein AAGC67_00440 [Myxococcota bacterium]
MTENTLPLDEPEALERQYRADPEAFRAELVALSGTRAGHAIARAWRARLDLEPSHGEGETATSRVDWFEVAALALVAGFGIRMMTLLEDDAWVARTAAWIVFVPVALVLRQRGARSRKADLGVYGIAIGALSLGLTIPIGTSSTGDLVLIHTPLLLWALVGIWAAGDRWRREAFRIDYVLRSGEVLVFTGAILLGGVLLTALTVAMFSVIEIEIAPWYYENVVLVGLAASPIVAAGLARAREFRGEALAPQLARIFSPLALATLGAYALAILWTGRSPHEDRAALIVLNAMLAAAAALIALATLSPQPESRSRWIGSIQAGIAWIAVAVDALALFSILYRTIEGGWTPNRVAVLGENLLLFVFLAGVAVHLTRFVTGRGAHDALRRFVAGVLPAFLVWTLFVIFALPALFGFA